MAEYSEALDYFVDESRVFIDQNSHDAIVIHGTGGSATQTAQQLGDYFRTTSDETSVHFGVDRAGVIAQYVRLQDGAAGNCCVDAGYDPFWQPYLNQHGNLNKCTISIEHINDSTNSLPLTDPQKQASFKLIAWICNAYNIAPDHIKSHASIAPINRALCPGPQYPWSELFDYLQSAGGDTTVLTIDQVSKYFTEVSKDIRWHCAKTNQDIAYGILTYYRTCTGVALNGLSQYGLPLSGEESVPNTKSAVLQRFERGAIIYDPANEVDSVPGISGPCYPAHIDKLPGQDPRIAQLQAEIATLQHQNVPQTPVVTLNTAAAISTIQAVTTALQSAIPALQSAAKDLEPS